MSICDKHIWPAFKFLLFAGTPIQKIFDAGSETHIFCNNQAVKILKNDSMLETLQVIEKYRRFIDLGNIWADKGCKCIAHYYRPDNGKGIVPFITAASECRNYFNWAISNWNTGKKQKSMFYLGAAAHIVQDMCVPHHAMGIAFNGHRKFENWIKNNKDHFAVLKNGLYSDCKNINDLINFNATAAQKYYPEVCEFNITGYSYAGKELLGLAQKTTAYLFNHFFSCLN